MSDRRVRQARAEPGTVRGHGYSVQTVRSAPREHLIEERGFRITRYHYYRQGHIAALRATYSALGVRLIDIKVDSYDAVEDEMIVRVTWH